MNISKFIRAFIIGYFAVINANIVAEPLSDSIGIWERNDDMGNLVERVTNTAVSDTVLETKIKYFDKGIEIRSAVGGLAEIGNERIATFFFSHGVVANFKQLSKSEHSVTYKLTFDNGKELKTMWTKLAHITEAGTTKMIQSIWSDKELTKHLGDFDFIKK